MKKRKAKRNKKGIKITVIIAVVLVALFILVPYIKVKIDMLSVQKNDSKYNVSNIENKRYTQDEIYSTLKIWGEENKDYLFIYENREKYPLSLLNSLIHNPEMLNFARGYLEDKSNSKSEEKISILESKEDNPLFVQWDKRWGYKNYGDELMAVAGCGPTALSMAVVSLTGNREATPYEVAQFSYNNGYFIENGGSLWTLISEGCEHYNVSAKELPLDKSTMINALDEGNILILVMGPGHFTSKGHFIVVYDYNEDGFYVNDPNSYSRSEKIWSYSEISEEIKNIWALNKK